jgi:hypothetical protein
MNMSHTPHVRDPFYTQALAEHRDLLSETCHLRAMFQNYLHRRPDERQAQEVTRRLRMLCEHLTRHFVQEQSGGYMEEAIMHLPRIGHRAEMLQRQHGELAAAAQRLQEQMAAIDPATCDWARQAHDFDQFMQRLTEHEAAENALLNEAFNEDPGTEGGS